MAAAAAEYGRSHPPSHRPARFDAPRHGAILGTASRISEVLRGKKQLSVAMIQRLRARFRVPADVLIPPPKRTGGLRLDGGRGRNVHDPMRALRERTAPWSAIKAVLEAR